MTDFGKLQRFARFERLPTCLYKRRHTCHTRGHAVHSIQGLFLPISIFSTARCGFRWTRTFSYTGACGRASKLASARACVRACVRACMRVRIITAAMFAVYVRAEFNGAITKSRRHDRVIIDGTMTLQDYKTHAARNCPFTKGPTNLDLEQVTPLLLGIMPMLKYTTKGELRHSYMGNSCTGHTRMCNNYTAIANRDLRSADREMSTRNENPVQAFQCTCLDICAKIYAYGYTKVSCLVDTSVYTHFRTHVYVHVYTNVRTIYTHNHSQSKMLRFKRAARRRPQ